MGVVSSLTELQQLSGTQWTKSWSLPLWVYHLRWRQRLNKAEKIMRQHELELGSCAQYHTLFSRCLWRERATTGTTPVTVVVLKADFDMCCCWLALSLCFSAEAKTDEVHAMVPPPMGICGPSGMELLKRVAWHCLVLGFSFWGESTVRLTLTNVLNLWG